MEIVTLTDYAVTAYNGRRDKRKGTGIKIEQWVSNNDVVAILMSNNNSSCLVIFDIVSFLKVYTFLKANHVTTLCATLLGSFIELLN